MAQMKISIERDGSTVNHIINSNEVSKEGFGGELISVLGSALDNASSVKESIEITTPAGLSFKASNGSLFVSEGNVFVVILVDEDANLNLTVLDGSNSSALNQVDLSTVSIEETDNPGVNLQLTIGKLVHAISQQNPLNTNVLVVNANYSKWDDVAQLAYHETLESEELGDKEFHIAY